MSKTLRKVHSKRWRRLPGEPEENSLRRQQEQQDTHETPTRRAASAGDKLVPGPALQGNRVS